MMKTIIKQLMLLVLLSFALGFVPGAFAPVVGGLSVGGLLQSLLALELVAGLGLAAWDLAEDEESRSKAKASIAVAASKAGRFRTVRLGARILDTFFQKDEEKQQA